MLHVAVSPHTHTLTGLVLGSHPSREDAIRRDQIQLYRVQRMAASAVLGEHAQLHECLIRPNCGIASDSTAEQSEDRKSPGFPRRANLRNRLRSRARTTRDTDSRCRGD